MSTKHKSCAVLIIDKQNRILLQHREATAPLYPNTWSTWGGGVHEDETHVQGAIRELEEELSIRVAPEDMVYFCEREFMRGDRRSVGQVFLLEHKDTYTYVQTEGDEMRFFSKEELSDCPLPEIVRVVLQEYFAKYPASAFK